MSSFIIASITKNSERESMARGAEHIKNLLFYTGLLELIQQYLQKFKIASGVQQ